LVLLALDWNQLATGANRGRLFKCSLQCRRILAGASALFPSNVRAAILNEENSGELGEVKSLPSQWEGERKIGEGGGGGERKIQNGG